MAINVYSGGFVGEDKLSSCARCPACFLLFDVLVGVFYIHKYYLKHSYIRNRHKYLNIRCISIHMIFLNIKFFFSESFVDNIEV